tara:strand:- start:50 stop:532 length:483 start_codon:yes stop_codon:yes gene_type:complete
MNIYKNFLKKEYSNKINKELLKGTFPWYYNKSQTDDLKDSSFFFHCFYNQKNKINSDYYYLIEPILKKLKIKNLLHVRANLCLKRLSKCSWHVDNFTKDLKHKTAIYYVNTNNGCTIFKNKKIKCEENKIVLFDADQRHKAKIQTNTDARMVINFNYESI